MNNSGRKQTFLETPSSRLQDGILVDLPSHRNFAPQEEVLGPWNLDGWNLSLVKHSGKAILGIQRCYRDEGVFVIFVHLSALVLPVRKLVLDDTQ